MLSDFNVSIKQFSYDEMDLVENLFIKINNDYKGDKKSVNSIEKLIMDSIKSMDDFDEDIAAPPPNYLV